MIKNTIDNVMLSMVKKKELELKIQMRKLSRSTAHVYWQLVCRFEDWRQQAYPINAADKFVMLEPEILAYISYLEITGKKISTIKKVVTVLRQYALRTRQGNPCGARAKLLLKNLTKKHNETKKTNKKDQ